MKLGYNISGLAIFLCYNRGTLCTKVTNLALKSVYCKRVFVNNRVRYNRVLLHVSLKTQQHRLHLATKNYLYAVII